MKKLLLLAFTSCIIASCNSKKNDDAKALLRENVDMYMQGTPVRPDAFPWFNGLNGGNIPEQAVLTFYLREGTITQEEFDALSHPALRWVKPE